MDTRKVHSRIASVAWVVLLYWAASGITLALIDVTDPGQTWAKLGGGPGARLTDEARGAPAIAAPRSLAAGIGRALEDSRGMPIAGVELRMALGRPRLQLSTADGDRSHMRRFAADTGASLTQLEAEGDLIAAYRPDGRDRFKSWHKGDALGVPGQMVGLGAGLTLAAMLVTGIAHFLRLSRNQRRLKRPALFWSQPRESPWRRLHRWIAVLAAAFLVNVAVTGSVLAIGELIVGFAVQYHIGSPPYPFPTPLPAVSSGSLSGDLLDHLQSSYEAGRVLAGGEPPVIIQLVHRDGRDLGLVTTGGARPRVFAVDMQGRPVGQPGDAEVQRGNGYFGDWHQVVKRLHRGDIVGSFNGRYFSIAVGLCLLYLAASGRSLIRRM